MITETLFSQEGVSTNSAQIEQLKSLFPHCFDASGRFLVEKFQSEIAEQTDISREFYEMNWLGKSYAKLLRNLPPETLICEDKTHNAKPENKSSQNVLIQGDNLDVLKHLKNAYTGKVKMIYIDPPYNTGSDGFVYQDDRKFTPEELSELAHISLDEAERILKFTAKGSNSHSAWLTFMYPRLYIARDLLKEDGVIFISIDDNEVAQLKLLCDEVFGEDNLVAEIIWQRKRGRDNSARWFSKSHEYIFLYAKRKEAFNVNLLELDEETKKAYKNPDHDPRGNYRMLATWARGTQGGVKYDFISKDGIYFPERLWLFSKENLTSLDKNDKLIFRGDNIYRKLFITENKGKIPETIWTDVSNSANASDEIKALFNGYIYFNTAKPIPLLKQIITISTDSDDLILDFFAGSGTTAHAVMQLNAEDNGNRQFILVQLPEKTDEKSEAFKAGYKTIFDITKARIEKAAAQIQAQSPNASGGKNIDCGFKIYQTTENFRRHHDEEFSLEQVNLPYVENLTDKQIDTLLTTWALNDGALLTAPICEMKLGNYTAHLCDKLLYLMQTGFTSADLLAFIQKLDNDTDFNPNRVIVFGENMPSHLQQELNQAIETYRNKKNIALSLIIRN
ncbi:site-specific DNA-methyltransferase [Aggregatibacter actinomycetemcomitans]|uniref:site-specific DNA-methyltransferase n=1 Tax=Aggregatibacter actinomycetemcomitans TaxID=714 RepID=UPI00197C5768|nr:site-specific DNA-methyltransferase [Aggregatibacter actinomycetemcomitans]MBN6063312.1 site-specific DNA-methyltransferase [Aggregatibacter actinomycetemcomitans]MBN6084675.1 site-specific DNA-methyltransferase [Aggregatibacter actinomycetemcomitans]